MNVAYLYYYGTQSNKLTELMKYCLLFAKELVQDGTRFDVFNCLSIMDNGEFLRELKFGVGDGILNFYMYNYHIMSGDKPFSSAQLATVLV
jgi:glycylpeptide N-tetradecanoyltransferase